METAVDKEEAMLMFPDLMEAVSVTSEASATTMDRLLVEDQSSISICLESWQLFVSEVWVWVH